VTTGGLVVGVLDGDLVAEESRRAGAPMGDERLGLVEFQLEVVAQELCQPGFDVFGLVSWSGESQQVIVGLCRGPGYAELFGGCRGR
jgi:hypothetical protein